jgi:membrane protease YdiL (CAAX protease family)
MAGIKRHSLLMFFILAFIFPWLVWGTTIAQSQGLLSFHIPQSLAFWIGLNLATYITAALTGGWSAIKDLFRRILRWRVQPIWYLIALFLTGVLSLASIGIHLVLGGTHQVGVLLSFKDLLPSLLFQVFFFLLTEETAWRGFALPRLQARYNALNSSLILGVLWGLWHLPLVFVPDSFQSTVPYVGFLLSTIATTIIMTWLFNHSHGSVLVAAVFHGATDATIAFSNVMTGDLRLFWIFIVVQWIAAGMIILTQWASHPSRTKNLDEATYITEPM